MGGFVQKMVSGWPGCFNFRDSQLWPAIFFTTMSIPNQRLLPARKRIALVAHDKKKDELIAWAKTQKPLLQQHDIFATGTTGTLLEAALNVPVTKFLSGPLGGDQQIGARIATGDMDVLIFFWDPMEAQPHDTDIKALLRLVVVWNIPLACDQATADFLMSSPLMQQPYACQIPDYQGYLKRPLPAS
jgi:methylglyoxal synthase